ncbi:MAG: OmpA family protein [Deltaproteobacteria bacterium]|nr:OmpA family protein [Deltaproteobacteria bacterium]
MHFGSRQLLKFAALAASLFFVACKPTYPKCDQDEHCKEKGEVCVNGQCQECRDDAQCIEKKGEGFICQDARCEPKPECNADADCDGKVCRANKCVAECVATTDCPSGKRCENQKCVDECAQDVDCGPGRVCIDGACADQGGDTTNISAQCRPMDASGGEIVATQVVNFEFDRFDLTVDAKSILDKNAECLKQAPQVVVVLEGHADERGTQEYNLALGEKRAAAVRSYLKNLGIESGRLTTRSKGKNQPLCTEHNEGCWSQNRRVEFIQSVQ